MTSTDRNESLFERAKRTIPGGVNSPVRAFKAGMAPIVIALLMATGWVLSSAHNKPAEDWRLWLLTVVVTGVVWRTRVPLLWLIAAGAGLGMLGWV